ncbi:MAG TPA: hypothetical protein VFJ76_07725 [Solirubrobacterales bacterium]|nr:hypothetical protein [Solirubrobacterales bacterium]
MDLVLPASVEAEIINAEMEQQADEHMVEAVEWAEELKRIDPGLDLVWVGNADDPELEPNRWHIRKRIPGSVDAYIALVGEGGSYRPPGAWMLEWLTANDLWNPRVHRDRSEAKRKLGEARDRARRLRAEQRQDHMAEAVRAARRIRDDRGMTQRSDLKAPSVIAEERRQRKKEEGIANPK